LLFIHGLLIIGLLTASWRWVGEDLIVDYGAFGLLSEFILTGFCLSYVTSTELTLVLDVGLV